MLRKIADITASPDVQPRVALHYPTVEKYKSAIDREEDLDALLVLFDGKTHWLYEGFHRLEAYKLAGYTEVPVDVTKGTKQDAILAAASSNYKHGLPRTSEDIERAVMMTIGVNKERGVDWTQEEIAKHCHCDQSTVSRVLGKYAEHNSPTRAEKRAAVARALDEKPNASAREIARALEANGTKVDHKTVEKVRKGKADGRVEKPRAASNQPQHVTGSRDESGAARGSMADEPAHEAPEPPRSPDDPFRGCGSRTRLDAVLAWLEQGEMILGNLSESGRDYMINEWAKRVKKLEGYAA